VNSPSCHVPNDSRVTASTELCESVSRRRDVCRHLHTLDVSQNVIALSCSCGSVKTSTDCYEELDSPPLLCPFPRLFHDSKSNDWLTSPNPLQNISMWYSSNPPRTITAETKYSRKYNSSHQPLWRGTPHIIAVPQYSPKSTWTPIPPILDLQVTRAHQSRPTESSDPSLLQTSLSSSPKRIPSFVVCNHLVPQEVPKINKPWCTRRPFPVMLAKGVLQR
jgi:hypothetical protein